MSYQKMLTLGEFHCQRYSRVVATILTQRTYLMGTPRLVSEFAWAEKWARASNRVWLTMNGGSVYLAGQDAPLGRGN